MKLLKAIEERHSVRTYLDKEINKKVEDELLLFIEQCNKESGLHIQLVLNEEKAFDGFMARYGKFSGVKNYIAIVGVKDNALEEKSGYYGEKIALKAQQLGLNTCWVGMSYSKSKARFEILSGEKLCIVIALGYGENQGVSHRIKKKEEVMEVDNGIIPEWFQNGIEAALLAPTAMNQQKFIFSLKGNIVKAKSGLGFYSKLDLGIVKYHFEIGAGVENFEWSKK